MQIKIIDKAWNEYIDYRDSQLEAGLKPSKYQTWAKHERSRMENAILEYFDREYCEGGGGLEMLLKRFTNEQITTLYSDLVEFFGELQEAA